VVGGPVHALNAAMAEDRPRSEPDPRRSFRAAQDPRGEAVARGRAQERRELLRSSADAPAGQRCNCGTSGPGRASGGDVSWRPADDPVIVAWICCAGGLACDAIEVSEKSQAADTPSRAVPFAVAESGDGSGAGGGAEARGCEKRFRSTSSHWEWELAASIGRNGSVVHACAAHCRSGTCACLASSENQTSVCAGVATTVDQFLLACSSSGTVRGRATVCRRLALPEALTAIVCNVHCLLTCVGRRWASHPRRTSRVICRRDAPPAARLALHANAVAGAVTTHAIHTQPTGTRSAVVRARGTQVQPALTIDELLPVGTGAVACLTAPPARARLAALVVRYAAAVSAAPGPGCTSAGTTGEHSAGICAHTRSIHAADSPRGGTVWGATALSTTQVGGAKARSALPAGGAGLPAGKQAVADASCRVAAVTALTQRQATVFAACRDVALAGSSRPFAFDAARAVCGAERSIAALQAADAAARYFARTNARRAFAGLRARLAQRHSAVACHLFAIGRARAAAIGAAGPSGSVAVRIAASLRAAHVERAEPGHALGRAIAQRAQRSQRIAAPERCVTAVAAGLLSDLAAGAKARGAAHALRGVTLALNAA